MVQERNQDRPPITRNNQPQQPFDTRGGGGGGGRREPWDFTTPRRDNNGGGGWGRIIAVALVVVLICCVFTYYWVGNSTTQYQTLSDQVNQALISLTANINALPDTIRDQINTNSTISSILTRLANLENSLGSCATNSALGAEVADLQAQIDAISSSGGTTAQEVLDRLDALEAQVDNLAELVENSDILHDTITTTVSVPTPYFSNNVTSGNATINIVVSVKNTKNHTVVLNKLDLTMDTNFSLGMFGIPVWFVPTTPYPLQLAYMSAYGTPTITNTTYEIFNVVLNTMGMSLLANETKTITFKCTITYTISGSHTEPEINSVVNNFSITPILTQNNYVLGS